MGREITRNVVHIYAYTGQCPNITSENCRCFYPIDFALFNEGVSKELGITIVPTENTSVVSRYGFERNVKWYASQNLP